MKPVCHVVADILRAFDASGQQQTLIYTRHDRANPYSPKMSKADRRQALEDDLAWIERGKKENLR